MSMSTHITTKQQEFALLANNLKDIAGVFQMCNCWSITNHATLFKTVLINAGFTTITQNSILTTEWRKLPGEPLQVMFIKW